MSGDPEICHLKEKTCQKLKINNNRPYKRRWDKHDRWTNYTLISKNKLDSQIISNTWRKMENFNASYALQRFAKP